MQFWEDGARRPPSYYSLPRASHEFFTLHLTTPPSSSKKRGYSLPSIARPLVACQSKKGRGKLRSARRGGGASGEGASGLEFPLIFATKDIINVVLYKYYNMM